MGPLNGHKSNHQQYKCLFTSLVWVTTNQRALKFSPWIKPTYFNVWVSYFVWNFKGTLWNSPQNILPIHWKISHRGPVIWKMLPCDNIIMRVSASLCLQYSVSLVLCQTVIHGVLCFRKLNVNPWWTEYCLRKYNDTIWPSVNSLAHERCGSNFTNLFFKPILDIDILNTSCEIGCTLEV